MEIEESEKEQLRNELIRMGKDDWDATIGSQRPQNTIPWEQVQEVRIKIPPT